jgi:hypothetical protein
MSGDASGHPGATRESKANSSRSRTQGSEVVASGFIEVD